MTKNDQSNQKSKLILVDDEVDVTEILTAYLEDDYDVTAFNDSVEAYEHLKNHSYDIMITDIRMPRMGGMELTRKSKEIHPDMKIIQCSGHATSKADIQEGISNGASGFISKPFGSPTEVIDFIESSDIFPRSSKDTFEDAPPQTPIASPPSSIQDSASGKTTALIIDDDEDVAEILAALIESEVDCHIITDELQALEIIKEHDFDFIISDLNMPQISGLELIGKIKMIKPKAKILISTGHGREEDVVKQAFEAGALDVITKPFNWPLDQILKLRNQG